MTKKFLTLILFLLTACLLAGIYGIIHDQFTYTISPEYYTKFKFYQFGLKDYGNEAIFPNPRVEVSVVGFLATWWMGIPIGSLLGLVGLTHKNWQTMFIVSIKAFLITTLIALITGVIGFGYGAVFLAQKAKVDFVRWYVPDDLIDFKSFIKVGSMHNFSYIGGLLGLLGGIAYSLAKRPKSSKERD